MGECRFESPYDGYGGVFCTVHDGEVTPVLCTHAAAGLERRLEAQATSINTYQQVCARLEKEKARLQRYPFEPICLVCGALTPCMTEADLKPGDPGIPCTFDPTPKQLFDQNAALQDRLAHAEAREAAKDARIKELEDRLASRD